MSSFQDWLAKTEGKTLEFKANTKSMTNLLKTVIAFANTSGGRILIGVEDGSKKVIGLANALKEEEGVSSAIADAISPLILPNTEIHTHQGKEVLVIQVFCGAGPYFLKKPGIHRGCYVRLGSTNRLADKQMLESLERVALNISFDELPCTQLELSELDHNYIQKLFEKGGKKITDRKYQELGLCVTHMSKKYPTHCGVILFGNNKKMIFPDAKIRCGCFLGKDRVNIIDQQDIESHLPEAIEIAERFIRRNTQMSAEIKSLQRKDIPEYPIVALREALVNAVLHADYSQLGCTIQVAIFSDRLEITNPGGLTFGMTLELAQGGASKLRNRAIGRVFKALNLIEQWGSGIRRIQDTYEQEGLTEPKFQELNNQFRVTLYSRAHKSKLPHWQLQLIQYLRKHKAIGSKDAAALWEITPRMSRIRLKQLVEQGTLKKESKSPTDPNQRYMLVG